MLFFNDRMAIGGVRPATEGHVEAPGQARTTAAQIVAGTALPLTVETDPVPGRLAARGGLTARTAHDFCAALRPELDAGGEELVLDLTDVRAVDIVGLAALHQAHRLAGLFGIRLVLRAGPLVHRALLDAELLDDVDAELIEDRPSPPPLAETTLDHAVPFLARTGRLGLRRPTYKELALFGHWAEEPLLDQMVGSELLYRCRHLGAYHPDFVRLVFADPASLTVLVEPLQPPHEPIGFLRLYNVRLAQEFAFLESAIADLRFLRRGWGVDSTRFLLAYGFDVLGLRRIEAKVYAYNVISSNSLLRGGFEREGVLRQARVYEGQRWDIFVYGILEDEMREQRKKEQFPAMSLWGDEA